MRLLWFALLGSIVAPVASATEVVGSENHAFQPRPFVNHPLLDLRIGADTTTLAEYPYLCLEISPFARISVEGCGTGAGLLHKSTELTEMAHFRARIQALETRWRRMDLGMYLGIGFAEIQRGIDEPGFKFGKAQSTDQIEAAGPEVSLSAKGRLWLHEKTYAVFDINAGAAVIPAAPTVMGSNNSLVGFGALTVGMGF